jgi:hypothetical protein
MKQNLKWLSMLTMMLIVFICLPSLVQAQFPNCPDVTQPCPIDGGLSLLIAAGVGYGVKKVRDSRRQKQAEENI